MPVAASDIKIYYSGGASNSNPAASLGGTISSVEVSNTPLNNLWDDVSEGEASAGDTEYRCIYIKNTHSTDSLLSAAVYIASNTPSDDTAIAIGLDAAGVGGTATTVANESSAPSGVSFSNAPNSGSALAIGTLGAGQAIGLWMRRTVNPDAVAAANDQFTIRVTGTPA